MRTELVEKTHEYSHLLNICYTPDIIPSPLDTLSRLTTYQSCEIESIFVYLRKLNLRVIEYPIEGDSTSKWQSRD